MQLDSYSVQASDDYKHYEFYSEGPKGKIKKVVTYRRILDWDEIVFNLAFGDWDDKLQRLNDRIISNNSDRQKILATVANTVIDFISHYPGASVYAEGSTPSRTRLYQVGIAAYWHEISEHFEIDGLTNGEWEPFRRGRNYEAFLLRLKY